MDVLVQCAYAVVESVVGVRLFLLYSNIYIALTLLSSIWPSELVSDM